MTSAYHLAQLNIAEPLGSLDSPLLADFVANIHRINAVAESAPGFVWRLKDDPPVNPFGPSSLVTLSVWADVTALSDFVHKSAHVDLMRRRREWFARTAPATMVLWWVPVGHKPTVQEAAERLDLLRTRGPGPLAFSFAAPHAPPGIRVMRFASAVRHDAAIDAWLAAQQPELGEIARAWFSTLRRCGDDIRELMHDSCPVACVGDAAFAYVNVFTAHVNVGFFQGSGLDDPADLLQGNGKHMRHVKLRPDQPYDAAALANLVEDAYAQSRLLALSPLR